MAFRYCIGGQLLFVPDHIGLGVRDIGLFGRSFSHGSIRAVFLDKSFERGVRIGYARRSFIFGEPQTGPRLSGLPPTSLAGPSDSVVVKECSACQNCARESAGKHPNSGQSFHRLTPLIDRRIPHSHYSR
jgi:hypothetical protein